MKREAKVTFYAVWRALGEGVGEDYCNTRQLA
jgi:hypothetical protein